MNAPTRRLVLLRHAQGSLGTDDYDRLSPVGHRQAQSLAEHLEAMLDRGRLVRGELRRHRETAGYLRRFGPAETDPDLNEYRVDHLLEAAFARSDSFGLRRPPAAAFEDPSSHLGTFLALFPQVLRAWQEERLECAVNGRWSAFSDRVAAAARRLSEALHEAEVVVAVTSAGVISTMTASLLERDLQWQRSLNVALYNASITELQWEPAVGWDAVRVNSIAHLKDETLHTLA
ncbi:MAG: histidine phosphatase family protein [Candidatus Wenzhouxiangella sp. M2_3B_020]